MPPGTLKSLDFKHGCSTRGRRTEPAPAKAGDEGRFRGPLPSPRPLYVRFCWTRAIKLVVNFVWPGTAARLALGTSSPWESKERRAGFSLTTRTVAWANKPAFMQGWV